MYAPVVIRFLACAVAFDQTCAACRWSIKLMPAMQDWIAVAKEEPPDNVELETEFRQDRTMPARPLLAGASQSVRVR